MALFRWPKIENDFALVKEYTESRDQMSGIKLHNASLLYSKAKLKEGVMGALRSVNKKHKAYDKKALKR